MKKNLILILSIVVLQEPSHQTCTSSAAVTNCNNELLLPNKPLTLQIYKPFLDLHKNNLELLPSGVFKNLPEVTILHLSFNKIRNVEEDSFIGLKKLKQLNLFDNQLTNIGQVFKHSPELEILSLGMNKINFIDSQAFANLQSLKELDLSFNELSAFPSGISDLPNLNILDLHYNKLNSLPSRVFEKLIHLKNLKLSDNKLTKISQSDFKGLIELEKLDMAFNSISKMNIENVLEDLPSLTYLKLGLNSFTCSDLEHIVRALKKNRIEVPKGYTKKRDNVEGMYCIKL